MARTDEKEPEETVTDDDPRLRGHALQDHDRVKAEIKRAEGNGADEHTGNPVRSNPDLVPGTRNEALEDVRRVRAKNETRTRARSTVAIEEKVAASTTGGGDKFVELATADGKLYLNTHGEAVLDRDGIVDLQRHLAAAFQAVS